MNIFPIIILTIVGINVLARWLGEQSKRAEKDAQQRKRYPSLAEGKGGRPAVVTRPPVQPQRPADRQRAEPVPGGTVVVKEPGTTRPARAVTAAQQLRRMDREFHEWFEEEAEEKGQVIWEAPQEDIEKFLVAQRKPVPVPPPAPPVFGQPEPKVEPAPPIPVQLKVEVTRPPAAKQRKVPARALERRAPRRAVLPVGVFENMDDVRRGIVMSEILGPPVSMR